MNVMIDLKTLVFVVVAIALVVLIVYLIKLIKGLIDTNEQAQDVLKDVKTITDLAAKRSEDIDGIVGDVTESVNVLSEAIKGKKNIFGAVSDVIKAAASIIKAAKDNNDK